MSPLESLSASERIRVLTPGKPFVLAPSGEPARPPRPKRKRAERGKGGEAKRYPAFDPEKATAAHVRVAGRGGEGVARGGSQGLLRVLRGLWIYLREVR